MSLSLLLTVAVVRAVPQMKAGSLQMLSGDDLGMDEVNKCVRWQKVITEATWPKHVDAVPRVRYF